MRPKDTYTREIMVQCVQEKTISEKEDTKHLEQGDLEISDALKTCAIKGQAICDIPSIGIPITVDDKTLEEYTQIYKCNLKDIDLAIIESWHRIVSKQPTVYTYPNIPENKLSNAKKFYAKLTPNDIVLGLWDITVFGSAKEGMLFTTRSVHWKDTSGEQAGKISFAELDTSKIQHKSKWPHINIVLGDNRIVMTGSYGSCKELMSFIIEAAILLRGSKELAVADDMNITADKSEHSDDNSNKIKNDEQISETDKPSQKEEKKDGSVATKTASSNVKRDMDFHDCEHCGTKGVLLMSDGRCPNCKRIINRDC